MREISIKIKTVKVGWERKTVNRRGKKFVYGSWKKPHSLKVNWTTEPVQPIKMVHDLKSLETLVAKLLGSLSQEEYNKVSAFVDEGLSKTGEERIAHLLKLPLFK